MIVSVKFINLIFSLKAQLMLGLLFFISGCEPQNNFYHITGSTMGTSYSVKFGTKKNDFSINLIRREIDSILIVLNQEMSTWDPKSTISNFTF